MRSGELNRRIAIEKLTVVRKETGEEVDSFVPWARPWAKVRDVSARERFESSKTFAERASVFRIRYRSGVEETMRIVYEGRNYKIVGISELGRREGLELFAEHIK